MKVYELRNLLLEYSPDADVLVYVPETKTLDEIKSHTPNGPNYLRLNVQLNLSEDGECSTRQRPQLEEGLDSVSTIEPVEDDGEPRYGTPDHADMHGYDLCDVKTDWDAPIRPNYDYGDE